MAFRLFSSAFPEGGLIPTLHTGEGADLSPTLEWSGEPAGTKSFALIVDDPEGIRDNLERAAKYACYALVNKLVFHEALLKRYAGKLDKLSVPEHIDKGEELYPHLEKYFLEAKEVTADYETVFGEDHTGIGNRIPFYSDQAVPHAFYGQKKFIILLEGQMR